VHQRVHQQTATQEALVKLMASVASDESLLRHTDKAKATLDAMGQMLEQTAAQAQGWTMPAFIAQARGALEDIKESLASSQPQQRQH